MTYFLAIPAVLGVPEMSDISLLGPNLMTNGCQLFDEANWSGSLYLAVCSTWVRKAPIKAITTSSKPKFQELMPKEASTITFLSQF